MDFDIWHSSFVAWFGFGKPKSRLGIDIGTASIKVVELSKEPSSFKLDSYGKGLSRFKLENYGLFELESIEEAVSSFGGHETKATRLSNQDLAWGIREVLKRGKIKVRDAVASVPSFSTFSTIITMPYLSERDMAKTIPFEARKYVPLPMDEVVLDWSIINMATSNQSPTANYQQQATSMQAGSGKLGAGSSVGGIKPPTVEVLLVAVRKEETERYRNIMKLAGLNLRALELENSALVRALLGNDLSPVAIINTGGRSTSILIVENGYERISHNYEVGGFEITKSISKSLSISFKRAEELKRSFGIGGLDKNIIQQTMSSLVDMMAFETKKTIHGYQELKNTRITKIILIGGLANMPNFAEYFSAKLGLPLIIGNPFARLIVPQELTKIQDELNATFAIAVGLAMREI